MLGWVPNSPAWWGGLGFLRFHASLFLTALPVLILINLIQSPQRLWIERMGLAWLALLVVHAAIAGIVWAIGLLREGADGPNARDVAAQPRSPWATVQAAEPENPDFRTSAPTGVGDGWSVAPAPPPPGASPSAIPDSQPDASQSATPAATGVWDGWTAARPASTRLGSRPGPALSPTPAPITEPDPFASHPDPAGDERVSWRKIAEAAWLAKPEDDPLDSTPDTPSAKRRP